MKKYFDYKQDESAYLNSRKKNHKIEKSKSWIGCCEFIDHTKEQQFMFHCDCIQ